MNAILLPVAMMNAILLPVVMMNAILLRIAAIKVVLRAAKNAKNLRKRKKTTADEDMML